MSRKNSGSKQSLMLHTAWIHSSLSGLMKAFWNSCFHRVLEIRENSKISSKFDCSGFLVAYIYFRTNAKGKLEKLSQGMSEISSGALQFFGLICYRFIRLTAPYMYVLLLVEIVMKYFHHHSVFEPPTLDHDNCPNYWWRNILYINTLFPVEQMVRMAALCNSFSNFCVISLDFSHFSLKCITSVYVVELVFG